MAPTFVQLAADSGLAEGRRHLRRRSGDRAIHDSPVMVAVPTVFDCAVASEVGDKLRSALCDQPLVIAGMSLTGVCDLAALGELCIAHEFAAEAGRELRVVVASDPVMRQFAVAGLDGQLLIYSSLEAALRAAPHAEFAGPKQATAPTQARRQPQQAASQDNPSRQHAARPLTRWTARSLGHGPNVGSASRE
jgi:hypothetical protein